MHLPPNCEVLKKQGEQPMKKRFISAIILLVLAVIMSCPAVSAASSSDYMDNSIVSGSELDLSIEHAQQMAQTVEGTKVRARVVEVIEEVHENIDMGGYFLSNDYQTLRVEVLEGAYKGQQHIVTYDISDMWGGGNAPRALRKGDMILAQFTMGADGQVSGLVLQFMRANSLLWLGIIFLAALIFFGGKRGLRSLVALVITCIGLIFVMVPAIVNGMNAVLAAILGSIFSISVTLIIIYGFTVKTLAAALGAGGGVLAAGIVTAIMNASMKMTGLVDEEAMYLAQSVGDGLIDLRGILLAAIIISVLGGTMDVGISIASALDELKTNAPDIKGAELMKSGINIGIDIMGASLNTLILAYVGASLHLLMLFYTYDYSMSMILNDEMIASELLQALTGSMGLLLTVPITSFVASALMCRGNFGKLTPDCFASVVMLKRLKDSIYEKISAVREKSAAKSAKEEEIPENLYAAVQKHMKNLEEVDADYFGVDDDTLEDADLYDMLRNKDSNGNSKVK